MERVEFVHIKSRVKEFEEGKIEEEKKAELLEEAMEWTSKFIKLINESNIKLEGDKTFELNLNSEEEFDKIGDPMSIEEFIGSCECGGFIDYDGFASELIINNRVVLKFNDAIDDYLYPSDLLGYRDELLELHKENKGLEIVWCNR